MDYRSLKSGFLGILFVLSGALSLLGQGTQPLVAIHDSELTRALENMSAVSPTPTGAGTTGKQWWPTNWHYFVMPEAIKEALRSDGTAFTVVGDSNITAGVLLSNGVPRFPIVFSLASEAVRDDEIAPFTNYVAAGGFLFVGSSAFTRNPSGSTRGDFAFANQMGLHMVKPGVTNWGNNTTFNKSITHQIVNDFPAGFLTWRLPASSEEVSWNSSASTQPTPNTLPHSVWQVNPSTATEVATGDTSSLLTIQQYGKGWFIYYSPMQPLITHGGWSPGMYTYVIFRRSIEWAFANSRLPVAKLSPWPYQYDSAYMVRHDLEDFANEVADIEASAQVELSYGAKGDYYFCTGTLREDMSPSYDTNAVVTSLRRAIINDGATIGPHNGGLKNANFSLTHADYNYWHWGPDEVLSITPSGYSSGKAYATTSLSNSFIDIERWFSGLMTNGMRTWCSPYFNATRENSFDLESQLGVKITGDIKLSPFPTWTFSTQTPGKRYGLLQEPVSEWFVGTDVAQSMEWHHTNSTVYAAVDFYYNLGALVNLYGHTLSTGEGQAGDLQTDYVAYCANTNAHPHMWPANAIGVYQWWLQRSNVQVSLSYTTNGPQSTTTLNLSGASNTNTAVELLMPAQYCGLQIQTNGVNAGNNTYRLNGQVLKLRVGSAVTNAVINYTLCSLGPNLPFFTENFDGVSRPALPAGWTTSATGGQSSWVTTNSASDSAPNAVFSRDAGSTGLNELDSPTINLPAGQATLSFRTSYNLESGYDGGVLEIKIGSGAFTDIITAGGNFVTGGYNISLPSGSPLVGQQAWSGNSGGFITTAVVLPSAAAGQPVRLRWRCATDPSNGGPGWWIDSVTISNRAWLCCGNTNAPVLPLQSDLTVPELAPLQVANTATDSDSPGSLTYQLVSPPAGASIDANGIINWTPSEAQGPGTYTLTTIVSDNGGPPLYATNSFTITVTEVNSAPILPPQSNRAIAKLTNLVVTNTATDSDIPSNTFGYVLLSSPTNASISLSGIISWTPTANQDGTTNLFQTVVTDNGTPPLSATNSFYVIVSSMPQIVLNSTALLAEGCFPSNNIIDAGETVTMAFAFSNIGLGDTANLVATLLPTNGISSPNGPVSYGVVPAGGAPVSQPFTFTANGQCGGAITAILQLQDGLLNLGTATVVFPIGQQGVVFSQNFDSVTAPALPPGWTTAASGAQSPWTTSTNTPGSGPNAAFSPDPTAVGQNELDSPTIALPLGSTQLSFRNNYNFETGTGTDGYDGGVLEIQIGGGSFTDILAAGGSFVSGGYNSVIDAGFSNPLAGRSAWSGTSSGYITTSVSLPASAAGQPIRLRWVCGTDTANGKPGWRIDSISITGIVCCVASPNTAPALPAQANRTIAELTTLTVTNTATDSDVPPNIIAYSLTVTNAAGVVTNASISSNGIITWPSTEAQGPSTNTFTTIATDNGSPPLSATNSFTVVVTEVNTAPSLPAQPNRTISELTTLTVTNTATDPDVPPNNLAYLLTVTSASGPVANANISSAGVITWTPNETQGPSTNTFTTIVTDNGSPNRTATNSFVVVVTEVNSAPTFLQTPVARTLNELTTLIVTNAATDSDIPPNILSFVLNVNSSSGPVANASISSLGVISWTPTEAQGPSTNTFTTIVTDNGSPHLSATNSFTVVVNEVNSAPTFVQTPAPRTINELTTLTVTNAATDSDIPANALTYSLVVSSTSGTVPNATISSTGVITWTPTEAQGPSTNTFTTIVTDDGSPALSATNSFLVVVNELNTAPVFAQSPQDQIIDELTTLTVTNSATDSDIPANALAYSLAVSNANGPVLNATISSTGVITWTPTEAQGPSTNTFTTIVTDDGSPALSATNSFTVVVNEVNTAPVFIQTPSDQAVDELTTLTVTNGATDSDIPANALTYSLTVSNANGPVLNATISSTGVITWTPTEAQGPSTNTFTTIVSDDGSPALSATNSFTVVVNEVNSAPVFVQTPPDQIMDELTTLTVTNVAADPDIPANNLTYSLTIFSTSGIVTNAAISSAGVITWSPTEAQGPSTNVFTTIVTDDGSPALSATNSFTVVVNEVNSPPVVQPIPDQTITLQSSMTVTNIATDPDLPANQLYFSLLSRPPGALLNQLGNPPAGAKIDTNGVITWTPTADEAPSTNVFTVIVTDNGLPPLSTTNSFMVTVFGPPVPLVIQSLTFSNNSVALTWSAVAGRIYRLQCTTDPTSTNWQDMSSDISASGSACSCSHSTDGAPYKFYRVLQVQ